MTQLKIFRFIRLFAKDGDTIRETTSQPGLEEQANTWLEAHPEVEVVNITYHEATVSEKDVPGFAIRSHLFMLYDPDPCGSNFDPGWPGVVPSRPARGTSAAAPPAAVHGATGGS